MKSMAASQDVHPRYLDEEDGLTQEFKDLLPSLPRGRGWIVTNVYQYQGFWYPTRHLQGLPNCQQNFQAQASDLLLVTTPKSGTTWLKAIIFAIVNRVSHPPTKELHPLLTTNPHDLVPLLELNLYADNQVPDLSSFSSPRLFTTHIPFVSLPGSVKESKCKVVYLCRNPKDTFISLWHFTNKLRSKALGPLALEEGFERFCDGVSEYGPFWDHVMGYWKQSLERPQTVFFFRFEDMKEEPATHVRRLAEFLGHPFSMEEEREGVVDEVLKLCSFDKLSNLDVNKNGKLSSGMESRAFFRRGEVGDWVNYLMPEMAGRLDQIMEQKFDGSGLKI